MKTYTTQNNLVNSGIVTQEDARLGRVVALGEEGRGRVLEKVKLDSRRPPTVNADGKVEAADVDSFDVGGRKRFALTAPSTHDHRILVRAHCGAVYTKGTDGTAVGYWGSPQKLVGGYGAFGDAGRIGTWDDGLWTMSPGDALWVSPSGGYKTHPYLLWYAEVGTVPAIWKPEEWRSEVLAGLLAATTIAYVEAALAATEKAGHKVLAEFVRGRLADRVVMSGATETVRRNSRWSAERSAVVMDSVTLYKGTEVKTEQVLADSANKDEAAKAATILAANVTEVKVARAAIVAAGQTFAQAAEFVRAPSEWDVQPVQAELLLGCVTAEEARKRDLSSVTLERWIPKADQDRVRSARPAKIAFQGKEYSVEYSWGGRSAKVEVPFGDLPPQAWLGLTGDLKLGDGTAVRVKVKDEAWEVDAVELSQLPAKIRGASAMAQLHLWAPPTVETPVELEEGDTPPNLEATYGRDPLTGEALVARVRWGFSYYGWVEGVSWGKADEVPLPTPLPPEELTKVREHLAAKKAERAETLAREAAQVQVDAVQAELVALKRQPGWNSMPWEQRQEVEYRSGPGWTAAEKMKWFTESKALVAKFEGLLAVNLREQAEAERIERETKAAADERDTAKYQVLLTETQYERGLSLDHARQIGAFVQEAINAVGLRAAVRIFKDEAGEAYGRGRRTDVLYEKLPGVDHHHLDWASGRDIVHVARWAEHLLAQGGNVASAPMQPMPVRGGYGRPQTAPTAVPTATVVSATFTDEGGRHFRCGCGYMERVGKSTYDMYQAGQAIVIVCNGCRKSGTVKK